MSCRAITCLALTIAVSWAQDAPRPAEVVETRPLRTMPEAIHRTALPQSGLGLAAGYPGDVNIRKDRRVLFSEDFEGKDPFRNWTDVKGGDGVRLVEDGTHAGKRSVSIAADLSRDDGGHLFRRLAFGEDSVYVRFYVKFVAPVEYVHHFVTLSADDPPQKFPAGGAGVCPDGGRRFSTAIEPFGYHGKAAAPGNWRLASYWCEMGISSDLKYWGNAFEPETPIPAVADTWTCVEFMIRANTTATSSDGAQAFWINGESGTAFEGYRWRTNPKLKLNGVWFLYFMSADGAKMHGSLEPRRQTSVLFDDIVVAREYIGPQTAPPPEPEPPKPEGDGKDGDNHSASR